MRQGSLHVGAMLLLVLGCAPSPSAELEANKELVRRFIELVNAAEWDSLEAIVAEDVVRHSAATPGPDITSRAAFVALQQESLLSFPDQHVTVHEMIAEGDLVAVVATYAGTQDGPMGESPATGRQMASPFLGVLRIASGRIVEMWVEWDNLALLGQLGLFPPPAP